ncbi:gluconate 2-dehydrogenase subunit 3 family protein [Microbulbifer epialgicus]|uniref:Gluconate 2-dehydrogenase subunit 3 family protein n=1 Tax=Microbulbifer epialgicus TaxID=393907 RepID=A0ABV4NYT3_9GAMM
MNRRNFLQGLAAATGCSMAPLYTNASALAAASSFFNQIKDKPYKAQYFSSEQLASVYQICSLLIPATETPGAAETQSHFFVDRFLAKCADERDQQLVSNALISLEERSFSIHRRSFAELDTTLAAPPSSSPGCR